MPTIRQEATLLPERLPQSSPGERTEDPGLEMFENFGLALRISRELGGLSQAELARRARMGKSQVCKYEKGSQLPRLPCLARLLRELKTTPYAFFYTLRFLDELEAGRALPAAPAKEASSLSPAEHAAFCRLADDLFALQRAIVEARIGALQERARGASEERR